MWFAFYKEILKVLGVENYTEFSSDFAIEFMTPSFIVKDMQWYKETVRVEYKKKIYSVL